MPNSNRGMFGRGTGTITVIEEPVMRSYRRKAKIVFYVAWLLTAALAATVAASRWPPVIALLAGTAAGLVLGAVAGAIVVAWPVIRAIWWWLPETILAAGLVCGWIELASHITLIWRLGCVALIIAVLVAIRPVRAWLNAVVWCLIARHRVRTCFSEFIITNRTGSLPLILWARPSRVGERVWVWLRPGLCLADIQARLDKIATACWASSATAEPASAANAAYIRIDIKRRDALSERVRSPLLALITPATPARDPNTAPAPDALELADVTADDVTPASRPPRAGRKPAPAPAPAPPVAHPDAADDITDWL
jgi:hypothetical protein